MKDYYPVYIEQNDLDRDLDDIILDHDQEDASTYRGRLLFNLTKRVIFVFNVQ